MSALAISTGPNRARDRLLADLPVTERRVRLARVSTALLEAGDGPPLVLLHGGIECGGAYWAPVISSLAEGVPTRSVSRITARTGDASENWTDRRSAAPLRFLLAQRYA